MAIARVGVKPEIIQWAIDRSGIEPSELRKEFKDFDDWMLQKKSPTLAQLGKLAKKTFTPEGYFYLTEAPKQENLPFTDFRISGNRNHRKPSVNLLDTIYDMQDRQGWMRDYLLESGAELLSFVGSASLSKSPEELADQIRTVLKLGDSWATSEKSWNDSLRKLRERIEAAGMLVFSSGIVGSNTRRTLDVKEFRGFVIADSYAPLIFINSRDAKAAQMFTLVHELAHIFLGDSGLDLLDGFETTNKEEEQLCNRTAAEFLLPERLLIPSWENVKDESGLLYALAQKFKVSPITVGIQARNLGLMTQTAFNKYYSNYLKRKSEKEDKAKSGGNYYATQSVRLSKRFMQAVYARVLEGGMLYRDAYRLTGLSAKTFEKVAQQMGIVG